MADVEVGKAFLGSRIVVVLRKDGGSVRAGAEEIGSAVDRFRISVGDSEGQAVLELFVEFDLQAVVIGTHRVLRLENLGEPKVRTANDGRHGRDVLREDGRTGGGIPRSSIRVTTFGVSVLICACVM